jgi:hypothetical protein
MLRGTVGWALIACALTGAIAAEAQMDERGFIIRVIDKDKMLYIDLGRRDGVQRGDIYDIVAADVLSNPLSGDTLAVSPVSVGALRVRQVFEKMSMAEMLHLEPGHDPMMMKIMPLQSAERLVEIEDYLRQPMYSEGRNQSSRLLSLVPGAQQFRLGQRLKGLTLLSVGTASLAAGVGYRFSSNDWKDQYDNLSAGLPAGDYSYYFEEANSRRSRSNQLFWLAGAVYAYHFIDLLWMRNSGMPMAGQERPRFEVTVASQVSGAPSLLLTCHF